MSFKLFKRSFRRLSDPVISITKARQINMNKAVTAKLDELKCDYVKFFWDEEADRIAILCATLDDPDAYPIHRNSRGNGGQVSGHRFCQFIGYEPIESHALSTVWNETEERFECMMPKEWIDEKLKKKSHPSSIITTFARSK